MVGVCWWLCGVALVMLGVAVIVVLLQADAATAVDGNRGEGVDICCVDVDIEECYRGFSFMLMMLLRRRTRRRRYLLQPPQTLNASTHPAC